MSKEMLQFFLENVIGDPQVHIADLYDIYSSTHVYSISDRFQSLINQLGAEIFNLSTLLGTFELTV